MLTISDIIFNIISIYSKEKWRIGSKTTSQAWFLGVKMVRCQAKRRKKATGRLLRRNNLNSQAKAEGLIVAFAWRIQPAFWRK